MISNKTIEITKDNIFDKSWALFNEVSFSLPKSNKITNVNNIVSNITYATHISLFLKEPYLHNKIIEEILWAQKYGKLDIELICKDKKIVDLFSNIKIDKIEIDENININYIAIQGISHSIKYEKYYLLESEIIETDDTILKNLHNKSNKINYDFLKKSDIVFVCDKSFKNNFSNVFNYCRTENIPFYYLILPNHFSMNLSLECNKNNVPLIISKYLEDCIVYVKDDKLFACKNINSMIISYEIASATDCMDYDLYLNNTIDYSSNNLPKEYICFENGELVNRSIKEEKIINRDIKFELMSDFVNEVFDKSEVDEHNQYCLEARRVKYIYTLIPPKFDKTYKYSFVYNDVIDINNKLQEEKFDLLKFTKQINEIIENNWFSEIVNSIIDFKNKINKIVLEYDYCFFDELVTHTMNLLSFDKIELLEEVKKIYNQINNASVSVKYTKFDDEIADYKKTISEKEKLIEKNIDILSNKRRVEILQKKIDDLIALKNKFSTNDSSRNEQSSQLFINKVENILAGEKIKNTNMDSVSTIVNNKELSKLAKYEKFLNAYLVDFCEYIKRFNDYLKNLLKKTDFPKNYVVYQKDKKNYIIINSIDEFNNTKKLCKQYNILTLTKE